MQAWELLQQFKKEAGAPSVSLADSTAGAAATAPLPELAVGNKPAPGLSGPKGLAPRTNYSRVNSGSPPPADLGASSQKGLPTDPQGFLPPKVAHQEVPMSAMTPRYTIQEMIKAAADGASDQVAVSLEGTRQLANSGEKVASIKTHAAPEGIESIPTNYVEKLAAAVAYVLDDMQKSAEEGAGTGPNALHVMEATSSNNEIEAGRSGTATSAHVPPKNPGEHKPSETPHGPANALEDNASMMHKEQPVKLSSADISELRKQAKSDPEGHQVRRALLGNPVSSAIEAKPGHKGEAFGKAFGHEAKEGLKGFGKGAVTGGAGGAIAGAVHGAAKGKGLRGAISEAGKGALLGGAVGGHVGGIAGTLKGRHGAEASRIHGEHSKHAAALVEDLRKIAKFPLGEGENKDDSAREPKAEQAAEKKLEGKERGAGGGEGEKEASASDSRLVDYLLSMTKAAEDAINPAKISAGAAVPPETSMAGEAGGAPAGGMPEGPRGLVGSNEAAINYQKREAKAPVKAQLARVLTEPALSAAHDHTLEQAFDNTGKAGVKIASSTRALAARAVLEKLAEEACGPDGKSKKKVSAGMGPFQAPQVGGVASSAM
jgi:hypothetical protein